MLNLVSLLSFLLPTQLGLHLNIFPTTVYGFSVDYLIPTIYLTDIVALLIITLGIRKIKFNYKYLLYVIFVALNISVSSYVEASVYRWFKVTEMIILGIVIFNIKKFDIFNNFIKPLSYSIFITCTLGILQFINKGSIGGIFYWFGERSFLFSDPNIAPYPYSIFSHPNSFAGFSLVFGIFLLQYKNKFNIKYFCLLILLIGINLILTNSLNVYLAIFTLFFIKFGSDLLSKTKVGLSFSFLTLDFSQRFVTHRLELIKASWQIIKENFLLGVGLNNFIPNLVKVSKTFVSSWELQPVHNIFLLIISETGIIGLVSFFALLFTTLTITNYPLISILLTGMNDHYWLTLQQNLLLLTFVVLISRKKFKK